ncbi:MAG TPA: helix-turn-helix transcriptional regulator [Bacilli bacterium]|nr:helix-turn-helix transcriptional regulator [Bacilli bacterium]
MFSLGQRIRELRMKKGLTQIELAEGLCTPSMISQIESDRARPSYKVLFALADRLDVALDKLLVDVNLNLEYVSTYKMARAMIRAQEYASAIPLLQELLETPRAQISETDIMYELGECYVQTDQLAAASKLFAEVQEQGTLRQDHGTIAQAMKQLGRIEFLSKRYQLAIYHWQRALEEADKMEERDVELEGTLHYHLGEVLTKTGQVFEALAHFEAATALFDRVRNLTEMAHVYKGMGSAYRMADHLDKATDFSEKAAALFETLDEVLLSLRQKVETAALYLAGGRLEEAERLLTEALTRFRERGDREEEGRALVVYAKWQWAREQVDAAEETCRLARNLLPELHVDQGWINRVLGDVALHRGQEEEALRRLQMAADCFKSLGEVGAWDETMYRIALLLRDAGEVERAYRVVEEIRRFSRETLEQRGIVL